MKTKKVKRKPKKLLIFIISIIVLAILGTALYFIFFDKETVKETKIVSRIDNYGYVLKSNKSDKYKKLFKELEKVLSDDVDEEKYAKIITEMFIVDFYSLGDRTAKTDVGGVDFVHESALENFILNAENTFYKYVESDIYGDRKQELPIVDTVKIDKIEKTEYSYLETIDENAYKITASWTYKDSSMASGYQKSGTFIFVHSDKKLVLVELSE